MSLIRTAWTRHVYLPALDHYKRTPVVAATRELERNERRPLAELHAIQRAKLNALLTHAARYTEYYAAVAKSLSDSPRDSGENELTPWPLLDKATVVDRNEDLRASRYPGRLFSGSTSGSTGIAVRFEHDSVHQAYMTASMWRHRGWWGLRRGDPEADLWGRPLRIGGLKTRIHTLKYGMRNVRSYYTFDDFDERRMREVIRDLTRFRPRFIYGYGSSIARLTAFMRDSDIFLPHQSRPLLVEYTADHMHASERETAAKMLGAPVVSQYGASETPGVAGQCRAGGMHISIDQCVVEFLRSDGSHADPGEAAELVITPLHNYAMPLIRYRVGDVGSYSADACACGVTLPLMNLTLGKAVELITTSRVSGVSAHILDYANLLLLRDRISGIRQFFVEQLERDRFRLDYVSDGTPADAALSAFTSVMRQHLGDQITVEARMVKDIPTPASGKRRYFANRVNPGTASTADV